MPGPWRSYIGTIKTICNSAASARSTSVVCPGIGSAKLKYSCLSDLQKYGALNSSLRQMICAPRPAASRMRAMVAVSACVWSPVTASWMSPIETSDLGDMSLEIYASRPPGALRLSRRPLHGGGDCAPEFRVRIADLFPERIHHLRDLPRRIDHEHDAPGRIEQRVLHLVQLRDLRVRIAREVDGES